MSTPLAQLRADLRAAVDPAKAKFLPRFFKAGPGEYGEGDQFIGVVVPEQRIIAKRHRDLSLSDLANLLASQIHEERLTALLILILQMKRATPEVQDQLAEFYLKHKDRVNNWDLVDLSARDVLGPYYKRHDPAPLIELAGSPSLWDRRIAMITTFYFIRQRQYELALTIAELLLNDSQDLIQKAVGWMLREIGNRDLEVEERFLTGRYKTMPRTMLRYAIEKFDPDRRVMYLQGEI